MLELEAQAEVDKFVSARLHHPHRSVDWWRKLFREASLSAGLSEAESARYVEAGRLAAGFCANSTLHPHVDSHCVTCVVFGVIGRETTRHDAKNGSVDESADRRSVARMIALTVLPLSDSRGCSIIARASRTRVAHRHSKGGHMARITVEDCLENIPNRFSLILVAAERTKQLLKGEQCLIEDERTNKEVVTALREIAANVVQADMSDFDENEVLTPRSLAPKMPSAACDGRCASASGGRRSAACPMMICLRRVDDLPPPADAGDEVAAEA